jgi:hypothetical protein
MVIYNEYCNKVKSVQKMKKCSINAIIINNITKMSPKMSPKVSPKMSPMNG